MKRTKLILFFSIGMAALLCFCFRENQEISIAQKLKNIPQDERQCLDFFFRSHFSAIGYCLFGNKPLAVIGYCAPLVETDNIYGIFDRTFHTFDPDNLRMYRGWQLWKKYQHFFPMKDFAFVKSKNFFENNHVALILINKKSFLNAVRKHLNDFKRVLGNDVTPELLLKEVLNSQDVFGDVLRHHQGLIGTLLGFGRHNSWLFHQREEIASLNGEISPLLGKSPNFLKKLTGSRIQEKLDALNQALQQFDDRGVLDFNPLLMGLPGFVADHNAAETQQLKAQYERQYRQIIRRYQEGDFLEITLKRMTSEISF